MPSMKRTLMVSLGVFALVGTAASSADAAGSSLEGVNGLIRTHSADVGSSGYVAGSLYGLYSREWYPAAQSPRFRSEEVKFAGSKFTLGFTPSRHFELAIGGIVEGQFVNAFVVDEQESKVGVGSFHLNAKALVTPPDYKTWMLGVEGFVSKSTGDANALVGTWDYDGLDLGGRLNVTYSYLQKNENPNLRVHMNAGYLTRTSEFNQLAVDVVGMGGTPPRQVLHGDQFLYAAALEFPLPKNWNFFTEWSGEYDMSSDAEFRDNPQRITPGVRWSAAGGSFLWTAGYEVGLGSDQSGPNWQVVSGITFGGYVAPVQGRVLGVVRDADTGEPVSNVAVSVRNSLEEPATSDGSGRFEADVESGYVVLELSADGYNPKTRVVEVRGHQSTSFDFTMTKRNVFGSLRGRVRDAETGEPLFGRVRIVGTGEWVDTDPASGAYFIDKVAEGESELEIEAKNYVGETVTAKILAGEVTGQDVALSRDLKSQMGVLSGYVHDRKTGQNIVATITARGKSTRTIAVDPATGLYEMELEAGTYNLSVTSQGYVAAVESVTLGEKEAAVRNFDLAVLPKKMTLKGVYFDSGAATIKRESFAALEDAAQFLINNPELAVTIEGHTDSMGQYTGNLTLSQRRADSVMKFLVVNYGVDPKRLNAKGLGPNEPIASNDTAEGRALNRRIEFSIEEGASSN